MPGKENWRQRQKKLRRKATKIDAKGKENLGKMQRKLAPKTKKIGVKYKVAGRSDP